MKGKITVAALQQMKRDRRKIVAVVVYDYQMAQIVDRAGVDIVSVGDSVGVNMWGQGSELEVTLDQMLLACQAVRRGVGRALVSCDFPYGPMQKGADAAVAAARVLTRDGGADMVKLDAAADHPEAAKAIAGAGIPVWAQFGITPHTMARRASPSGPAATPMSIPELAAALTDRFVAEAKLLEAAGAALLDFTHSGPVAGPAVAQAVAIPVMGGLGGGPWLDGRVRAIGNAIGYTAAALDDGIERYANVARVALDAIQAYAGDVRAGKQIKGK
ncbi:MAG: 3-methyl-2-oxobutanoate hydroxymethyltransferase [Acidobacteria bacterium]|nr:3-methyl-2-oxobutanoate hydroxymethyltransferase [Acidobacteriota bacterium]